MEDMRKPDNFPGYTVRPLKDLLSLMTSTNIPGLQVFIDAMIALAVSIAPAGDFSYYVHHGDRTHPRYRCAEIAWMRIRLSLFALC